jgi:hypothetical protein
MGVALSKSAKLEKMAGMGPAGPAPGDAFKAGLPSSLDKRGRSIGIQLPRPREFTPGPADTAGGDPHQLDLVTRVTGPSWGSLGNRSSVRKPPWREVEQPPVFELKSGEKLIMTNVPIQFKPTGPKWSMMKRRPNREEKIGMMADSEEMVVTTCFG